MSCPAPFPTVTDPKKPASAVIEEKYPASKGEFGTFCPVTYKDDRWLFYAPENLELQVNQRTYRFAGEKEMDIFKKDPSVYMKARDRDNYSNNLTLAPVAVPPPHIFFTGYQGAGVSFFTDVLCKEFKLKKTELKKDFLEIWEAQKKARKAIRIAKKTEELIKKNEEIKAGNLANPEQEPQELLNVENELANDATLDDEEEGYSAVDNDKNIFKKLFSPEIPSIYDASWYDMDAKVATPFFDLMFDTRRVPNVFVFFKVAMKTIIDRHFHIEIIQAQHKELVKISNDKRKQKEDELINKKKMDILDGLRQNLDENLNDGTDLNNSLGTNTGLLNNSGNASKQFPDINKIKLDIEQEEKDEIWNTPDPELPELETLVNQEKEKLLIRYEANVNAIGAMIDTLKEKGFPVIEIFNDLPKENVYKGLLIQLELYLKNRQNLIERQLVNNKVFPEGVPLRRIKELINNSQVYKLSSYGLLSPVNPNKMVIRTDYPLVYRDRIYLFNNEEEKNKFADRPLDYRTGSECPLDAYPIRGRNIIFVIGQMRSGKTTISKMLENSMGYVRISVRRACMDLISTLNDCLLKRELVNLLTTGNSVDDNLVIKVLSRRLSLEDMINKDIVIDGFPYTISQADLLTSMDPSLSPTYVFVCECDNKVVIKRAYEKKMFK